MGFFNEIKSALNEIFAVIGAGGSICEIYIFLFEAFLLLGLKQIRERLK